MAKRSTDRVDPDGAAPAAGTPIVELVEGSTRYRIALPHADTDYIQGRIAKERVPYEQAMLEEMAGRVQPGDLVLDIGANVGNHTLYLACVCGCEVESFEPNASLAGAMEESIRINNLEAKVRVHPIALGREDGSGGFEKSIEENLGAQRILTGEGTIAVRRLDGMHFGKRVAAIKIDVEGMEADVILGGEALIRKDHPLLYVECSSADGFARISRMLEPWGYGPMDKFNATPTYLFVHDDMVREGERLAQLMRHITGEQYEREAVLVKTRSQLLEANEKYRRANEQIAELKAQAAELAVLKRELTGREKRIGELEPQLQKLAPLVEDLHTRLDEANEKYRGSSGQLAELKAQAAELAVLKRELAGREKRIGELEPQLQKLAPLVDDLRTRLDEANAKYRRSNEQIADLKAQAAELAVLKRELASREKRIGELEPQLQKLTPQVDDLRARLDEANAKYRRSTEQLAELKEKNAELRGLEKASAEKDKRLALLETERKEQQQQFAALRSQLDQALADHRSLLESLSGLQAKADQVEALQQSLEQKTAALDSVRAEAARERDALESEFECRLAEKEDTLRQSVGRIAELEATIVKKDAELQALEANLQSRQVELFKAQASGREAGQRLTETAAERDTIRAELRSLRSSISYRLGRILTSSLRSPREWPSAIRRLWMLAKDARRVSAKAKASPLAGVSSAKVPPAALPESVARSAPDESRAPSILTPQALASGLKGLKVACILDEFSYASYAPEAQFTQLTPGGWEAELEACQPDLLFVESAWRGKDDLWGNKVGHCSGELQGIVAWCRAKGVPTAFWNKEDPVHFETFLNTAHRFDYVFTTDIDCIHRYKGMLGHDRVFLLPFACQPRQHNPIETYPRKDAFCFAGAYYVRYPERTADLSRMVSELSTWRGFEIYDRNFGGTNPDYQFPSEYDPFIVGNLPFDRIDKAYKGYRYAINLNSIKQSQSMFARRVFELLASNTVTVSNYSRGLRLLFGDLVFCSDQPRQILDRLSAWEQHPDKLDPLRLIALRKVLKEHTYARRLARVVAAMSGGQTLADTEPHVVVVARADSDAAARYLLESYERQTHKRKSLLLVIPSGIGLKIDPGRQDVRIVDPDTAARASMQDFLADNARVCGWVADDHYGPHYLEDLVLATQYTDASGIGKNRAFNWTEGAGLSMEVEESSAYQPVECLRLRSSMVAAHACGDASLAAWLDALPDACIEGPDLLTIDRFNYCAGGCSLSVDASARVDGAGWSLSAGVSMAEMETFEARIAPEPPQDRDTPLWTGAALAEHFRISPSKPYAGTCMSGYWQIESRLPDGQHEYLYATKDYPLAQLADPNGRIAFHLETTPGLNLQLAMLFLDSVGTRLGSVVKGANRNHSVEVPDDTVTVRLGIRIYAAGCSRIVALHWGSISRQAPAVVPQQRYLLVTNQYPAYDNLYRNGFVHSRVRAYREKGVGVDVFRMGTDSPAAFREFEGIDVVSGDAAVLDRLLATATYSHVMVHFLSPDMWKVLQKHVDRLPVTVWVHGFEIHGWQRRAFNLSTEAERQKAMQDSEARMAFWRLIFNALPFNLHFVFVSRSLANEAMEDVGMPLPESAYSVIPNPIDTGIFRYEKKDPEQRKRILSVRPFASRQYANDLSVAAIQLLSKEPFFKELEFRIIGNGALFEETLAPIRNHPNVTIERRFLAQPEIAALHRDYGIFLCPTRWDSHGVSRDEAMASGLVPVTNRVAAIPEFVDDACGILADPEDAAGLASGIARLFSDPSAFEAMSLAAHQRVMSRSSDEIVSRELVLFRS